MSILNAFVLPDVALFGVDTEVTMPDGSTEERGKMIPIPHLSAVVGFRGAEPVIFSAMPSILTYRGDFDDLAANMPRIFAEALCASRLYAVNLGRNREWAEHADIVLVGYSPKHGRMMGHAYKNTPDVSEIQHYPDFPQAIAPEMTREEIQRLKIVADKAGMMKLAVDQCRITRERGPAGTPAGGRFFIAEIRKGSITIEQACELPKMGNGKRT